MKGQSHLVNIISWVLGILALGILVGIAWKFVGRLFSGSKSGGVTKPKAENEPEQPSVQSPIIETDEAGLNDLKTHVVVSISERHKAAADIAKTAMDNIFSDEEKNEAVVSGNKTEFDNLLGDLNKLSE